MPSIDRPLHGDVLVMNLEAEGRHAAEAAGLQVGKTHEPQINPGAPGMNADQVPLLLARPDWRFFGSSSRTANLSRTEGSGGVILNFFQKRVSLIRLQVPGSSNSIPLIVYIRSLFVGFVKFFLGNLRRVGAGGVCSRRRRDFEE